MNEPQLRKLFRAAGHDQPARDLTERIMSRVAVTRIAQPTMVRPLISAWGWAGVGVAAMLLLVAALMAGAAPATTPAMPYAAAISERLGAIRLPSGAWPQWLIGSSLLALFFAVLLRKAEHGPAA
jgi:hypothetical protein